MQLLIHDVQGQCLLEGQPGRPLLRRVDDVSTVIEACYAHNAGRLILYPENLPERFFDLSSGEAGEILQKLRNYQIRLAIVRSPTLQVSRHFDEMVLDEQRGPHFRMFDSRDAAQQWLCSS